MKSYVKSRSDVEEWVRTLVLEYNFVPLAHKYNLQTLFRDRAYLCWDINCIKKRAMEILTVDSDEAELYRQAIYRTLALHGFAYQEDMYVLARLASRVLRGDTTIDEEVRSLHESITGTKSFRKSEYKKATKLAMTLVMLNYAYVPPHYTHDIIVSSVKRPIPLVVKTLGATLQSLPLLEKIPFYSTRECLFNEDEARELIDFAIELRQRAVKIMLEKRPKKLTDLLMYLTTFIEGELKRRKLMRTVERFAQFGALIEALMVPYYLNHYGFVRIDTTKLLFFELASSI